MKALTPKLQSVDTEIGLVLSTMATNQAATAQAIQDALNKGASPETLAAIKTASDKADADLLAMQTALATPPPAAS